MTLGKAHVLLATRARKSKYETTKMKSNNVGTGEVEYGMISFREGFDVASSAPGSADLPWSTLQKDV